MKAIYFTSKAILKITQIAVVAVLVLSVIPLAAGGIVPSIENEPTATIVNENLLLEGSLKVESTLMWDITDFSYKLEVVQGDIKIAESSPIDLTIRKGETTYLPFSIEIPMLDMALLMLSSGVGAGGFIGAMEIPLRMTIQGNYIQGLAGFNMTLDLSIKLDEPSGGYGSLKYSGNILKGTAEFDASGIFGGMINEEIDIEIDGLSFGFVKVSESGSIITVDVEIGNSSKDLLDALKDAGDVTVKIGSDEVHLNDEEIAVLIDMLEKIINTPGVSL